MVGILLAAGFSRRFGASNKLLHALPNGCPIALAAAQNLVKAIPLSIAVIRPENKAFADLLLNAGLKVCFCSEQDTEMADSLSAAIKFSASFTEAIDGFVIALADMPYIDPLTITKVVSELNAGASIVIPSYQGNRGHPVGFSAKFRDELESLSGDEGARSILKRHSEEINLLECGDSGILTDIDTLADLML